MDLQTQEKVSKLIREQADKLGIALKALREIRRLSDGMGFGDLETAVDIASAALTEISDYGKNPKDL
jgi:hypothetical protein